MHSHIHVEIFKAMLVLDISKYIEWVIYSAKLTKYSTIIHFSPNIMQYVTEWLFKTEGEIIQTKYKVLKKS